MHAILKTPTQPKCPAVYLCGAQLAMESIDRLAELSKASSGPQLRSPKETRPNHPHDAKCVERQNKTPLRQFKTLRGNLTPSTKLRHLSCP